jgi:receptor protein-tyrosine kinase
MTERPQLVLVANQLGLTIRPEDLVKEISVSPLPNTQILDVAVKDTNPALARDLANQLVAALIAEVKGFQTQETQTPNSRTGDDLVIVSPAVLPDRPASPNIPLDVAIAFAAGLVVAIAIAFLLDHLDQSIKSDDELSERTGMTAIGHIAFVAAGQGKRGELVTLDASSHSSEAYKALRTSLLFSAVARDLKVIVITSAEQGEGKSRTAGNLAVALAHADNKTLLIDADFRRPSQHRIFGRIRNIGLSNLILKDVDESQAITNVESVPNLWLLTSGPTPPNPSELLGSSRMKDLLAALSEHFAYLIVDTPPLNAVTDASVLASYASGVVVVVEQGRTTFPAVRRAKQTLDRVGAYTIGAVMNKLRARGGSYAYEYGYYASPRAGAPGRDVPRTESETA